MSIHNAVKLGQTEMESFKETWPGGFHDTIPKAVNTVSLSRKHLKIDKSKVFDTETIYARAMTLQATSCGIDAEKLWLMSWHLFQHQCLCRWTYVGGQNQVNTEKKSKGGCIKPLF